MPLYLIKPAICLFLILFRALSLRLIMLPPARGNVTLQQSSTIVCWPPQDFPLFDADGLAMDSHGYLWAAANQADEIVMFEATGKVHGTLGMSGGVGKDGAHNGLLFPASLVISDDTIYVTNLALALTSAAGDEVEEAVSKFSISVIKIPQHK